MNYDFGDILDARDAPNIGHFIIIVGEVSKKGGTEVMYYIVTSRVYAVFKDILNYFNDCLARGDKNFIRAYSKEKGKMSISAHGHLSQAVFLDKYKNYDSCFDLESMIVVNRDPERMDKSTLESLKDEGRIKIRSKLVKLDALNLIQMVRCSNDVSEYTRSMIGKSFNLIKATLR